MKTAFFVLLMCWSLCAQEESVPAVIAGHHCKNAADNRALRQIADVWMNGYNNGDSAKVAALYAEDAYYLTQHFAAGIVHGREKIQAYVKKGTDAHYRVDKIEVIETTCSGDFGYAISRYESTNGGQKAFGVNLLVLKKIGGRWYIVAHEAAVPDVATAIQSLPAPQ